MDNPISGWKLPRVAFAVYLGQGTRSPAQAPLAIAVVGPRAHDSGGTAQGSQNDNDPLQVTSVDGANSAWGDGSAISRIVEAILAEHPSATIWGCSCEKGGGATRGTWTVSITGTASAAGTLRYAVADMLYEVSVDAGATNDAVGAALEAAINAKPMSPVIASYNATTDTLTLTCKWYGPTSADVIPVALSVPAGLTVGSPSATPGATECDWASAYDALFNYGVDIAYLVPATRDETVLTSGSTALRQKIKAQLAPLVGHLVTVIMGRNDANVADLSDAWDLGTTNYDETAYWAQVVLAHGCPAEPWRMAGSVAGARAKSEESLGPNGNWIGLTGYTLSSVVLPWSSSAIYAMSMANTAVLGGISPVWWDFAGGKAMLLQSVCCKHLNGSTPDPSLVDSTNVPSVVRAVSYGLRSQIASTYSGFRAIDDVDGAPPEVVPSRCVSPLLMKDWLLSTMRRDYESRGWVQGVNVHASATSVIIDPSDPSTMLYELPLDVPRWLLRVCGHHREIGG